MAYYMPEGFVWDLGKSESNQRKHGVSFIEACELLHSKADYVEIIEEAHSQVEPRFIAIGPIRRGLVLVVYTEWTEDTIRIISARWAGPAERELYRSHMEQQR
jgi:uncharacterized DUF497 family protein